MLEVLQYNATHCNTLKHTAAQENHARGVLLTVSIDLSGALQRVAACCSVLQRVAACCSVLQRVAACYSVLQCVAACCIMLQWRKKDHQVGRRLLMEDENTSAAAFLPI